MHVQPLPQDPYKAAQIRAAVDLELPVVAGVVVLTSAEQVVAHRERTYAILEDESVLTRHEAAL